MKLGKRIVVNCIFGLAVLLSALSTSGQQLYDPYMWEPLPVGAPEWMKEIEKNPSGVNFTEIQRQFNDWRAKDVDVRVRTLDHKQVVNYYRRWMSSYRQYAGADGVIRLPKMTD